MENFLFLSDEVPTLETLDFTIRIGSTPTFSYFDMHIINVLLQMLRFCVLRETVCIGDD